MGINWTKIWEQLRKIVETLVKRFFQVKDYIEDLPTKAEEESSN
jgi:hypothetical protein